MQILLGIDSKPNIYLVKRLIPLTHWAHHNCSKKSVLDFLQLGSEKHAELAPFIIKSLYEYVMRQPDVSKNEDVTKQSIYSGLELNKKKKYCLEQKLRFVKTYIEDRVAGLR
jgi:hypothetical protein